MRILAVIKPESRNQVMEALGINYDPRMIEPKDELRVECDSQHYPHFLYSKSGGRNLTSDTDRVIIEA
jgi:hypothetical protein